MNSMQTVIMLATNGDSEGPTPGGPLGSFLVPMILMIVVMYVIMFLPQRRKQKKHEAMLKRLKAGDRVVTSGGIHGTIAAVKDSTIMLKIAEKTNVEVSRGSIINEASADEPAAAETTKKS